MEKIQFLANVNGSTSFCTVRPSSIDLVEYKHFQQQVFVSTASRRYQLEPDPRADVLETLGELHERMISAMLNSDRSEPELLRDCARAARMMVEALPYLEKNAFAESMNVIDNMRKFVCDYEHAITIEPGDRAEVADNLTNS